MLDILLNMIKFKKSSKTAEYQPTDVMVASLSLEREEDGFVMVGETADERSTVKPGDAKNMESPPSYDLMVKSDTDMQMYQNPNDIPDPTTAHASNNNQRAQDDGHGQSADSQMRSGSSQNQQQGTLRQPSDMQRSIDDVPFRFHSSIEASLNQDQLVRDISDVIPNIWTGSAEYEYNFFTERSVLEDT